MTDSQEKNTTPDLDGFPRIMQTVLGFLLFVAVLVCNKTRGSSDPLLQYGGFLLPVAIGTVIFILIRRAARRRR